MAKLWQKNVDLDSEIERFTVGEDYLLDMELLAADVLGSIAHAKMLSAIGILTEDEFLRLKDALKEDVANAARLLGTHSVGVQTAHDGPHGRFHIRQAADCGL